MQAKFTVDDDSHQVETNAAGVVVPKQKEKYSGAVDVLRQVYADKGFSGWYQGMQAQITKAVFSQALLFGIKDALEVYVLMSLIAYGKYSRSAIGLKQPASS